jgi:hypothetical protein
MHNFTTYITIRGKNLVNLSDKLESPLSHPITNPNEDYIQLHTPSELINETPDIKINWLLTKIEVAIVREKKLKRILNLEYDTNIILYVTDAYKYQFNYELDIHTIKRLAKLNIHFAVSAYKQEKKKI